MGMDKKEDYARRAGKRRETWSSLSEEEKRKRYASRIGRHLSEETKRKIGKANKNRKHLPHTEEHKNKIKNSMLNFYANNPSQRLARTEETRKVISKLSAEERKKRTQKAREGNKKAWLDPIKKEKRLSKIAKALNGTGNARSNNAEKWFLYWLRSNGFPFHWAGNGSQIIAGKFPDFVHDFDNKIIELYGDYFHTKEEEVERIEHFKNSGWDCIIVWLSDFERNPRNVLERLFEFNSR